MPKLLVVDDEPNVRYSLEAALAGDGLAVVTADTARAGIDAVRSESPDAVILDVRLPDMSGLDAFQEIHKLDPRLPVIIVTAHGTTDTAIEAMRRGAFDYLMKPVDLAQLRDVVERALELSRLSRVPAVLSDRPVSVEVPADRIVGNSRVMQEVYKDIGRVAPRNVNVLILGESGTGKELVARALFQYSSRQDKPFLAINCAAIPENLLESELFGHERGAFTGAEQRRIGKFEQADGGTIFLDEIGDMSPATQAKILRLLQEQRFERVGGNQTIETDVRVVAATNRELSELVARRRFRQDLYYRLNVFTIRLPPLRERMDDLPLLVDYFMARFNRELGKKVHSIAPDAMARLMSHAWPGNVRELQSAVKYALLRARGEVLTADCLPTLCIDIQSRGSADGEAELDVAALVRQLLSTDQPEIYATVLAEVDRVVLREVLNHVDGNQVAASELLGMSRNTLRSKIRMLGLTIEKQVAPETEQ